MVKDEFHGKISGSSPTCAGEGQPAYKRLEAEGGSVLKWLGSLTLVGKTYRPIVDTVVDAVKARRHDEFGIVQITVGRRDLLRVPDQGHHPRVVLGGGHGRLCGFGTLSFGSGTEIPSTR